MNNMKKRLAVLLSFALIITGITVSGYKADAQDNKGTITVNLRVEDTDKTLIESTKVTINQEEALKYQQLYQVSPETATVEATTITVADVLAKQISQTSKDLANDLTFSWGSPAHIVGENTVDYSPYWSFRVNNVSPADSTGMGYVANTCPVKDGDSIVLFRQACYDATAGAYGAYTSYGYFDKDSYETMVGTPVELTYSYDDGFGYGITPGADMTLSTNNNLTAKTDANGKASLTFDKAGSYVVTSTITTQDGIPSKSLAYAVITVKDNATATPSVAPSASPSVEPSATPSADATVKSAKKPATPKKFTAKVKKSKKKNVTFTWKKVANVDGYVLKSSKKKNKGFAKLVTSKKTTATIKLAKGTRYVTLQSYKKEGKKTYYSAATKAIKVVVK